MTTASPTHSPSPTPSASPPLHYSTGGRILQTTVLYGCTAVLGALIVTRFSHHYKQLQFTRFFALVIYWLTIAFIILISLQGELLDGVNACYATYYMTLSFFVVLKTSTLVVLVLRTRPLSKVPLYRDPMFLFLMVLLLCSLVNIFYRAFQESYVVDAQGNGTCMLGFPFREACFLLGFDVAYDIALAFLFLWHLRRHTRNTPAQLPGFWPSAAAFRAVLPFSKIDPRFFTVEKQPEYLAAKALVAAVILTLSTSTNLTIMLVKHSREDIWVFLSTCTLDRR